MIKYALTWHKTHLGVGERPSRTLRSRKGRGFCWLNDGGANGRDMVPGYSNVAQVMLLDGNGNWSHHLRIYVTTLANSRAFDIRPQYGNPCDPCS